MWIAVALVLAGAIASALLYFSMPLGPGVSPDSTIYIGTAKSLIAGDGFWVRGEPMTHYPPAYPLLLAAISPLNSDMLQSARILHALLYAANLMLFGLSIYICTKGSRTATACAILVFLTSKSFFSTHSMAWSEAPFLTFALICMICVSLYLPPPPNQAHHANAGPQHGCREIGLIANCIGCSKSFDFDKVCGGNASPPRSFGHPPQPASD